MSEAKVEYMDLTDLQDALLQYKGNAEREINDVLHNESFLPLTQSIISMIHPSGKKWKGKGLSSTSVQPFRAVNSNLAIEIKSKKDYHYLYFPDDGSDTIYHQGGQQFMLKGTEKESEAIIELCLARLTKEWSDT